MKLSQMPAAALRLLGYAVLSKVTLAINAAAAATIKTAAFTYIIDGIQKTQAALAAQVLTPIAGSAFYVQPENTTVYYTFAIDSAGAIVTIQGGYDGQQINSGGIISVGQSVVPDVPDLSATFAGAPTFNGVQTLATTYVPFGILKVATKPGQTFKPGTDALDAAAKATYTWFDVSYLPAQDRP